MLSRDLMRDQQSGGIHRCYRIAVAGRISAIHHTVIFTADPFPSRVKNLNTLRHALIIAAMDGHRVAVHNAISFKFLAHPLNPLSLSERLVQRPHDPVNRRERQRIIELSEAKIKRRAKWIVLGLRMRKVCDLHPALADVAARNNRQVWIGDQSAEPGR
jgi:hypothetical protein